MEENQNPLVNFHFITSEEAYTAPEQTFSVEETTNGDNLNSLLRSCLEIPENSEVQFFFLSKKVVIDKNTTLKMVLKRLNQTSEQELVIEFFLPHFKQPQKITSFPHEDAVLSITSFDSK